MKKKIVISGGSGFFGTNFYKQFKNKYKIFLIGNKTKVKKLKINFLDLYNCSALEKYLIKNEIKFFIHAAALTNVDYCESHSKKALKVNVDLTKIISKICHKLNIFLIYISSDQIFNYKYNFKTEKDKPNPLNVYGYSKYMAERQIIRNTKKHLIIRTNFFGKSFTKKKTLCDWIISNLKKRKKTKLFDDVFFNPVNIITLIKIIGSIIDGKYKIRGIINVASDEALSKYTFGRLLCKKLNLNDKYIIKSKIANNNNLVLRPKNMTLDNSKLKNKMSINKISIIRELNKILIK